MEIKLIKLDHPDASIDSVQKVKELQATNRTAYYRKLALKMTAEDTENAARDKVSNRHLLSDLHKSMIAE